MATKTPPKGKKTAAKDGAPKRSPAPKAAKVESAAKSSEHDDDDDEDDEAPAPVVKKPAAAKKPAVDGPEPPVVVPARRLTPEAKAQVNAMVQKGIPLAEALKMAASWETFVAPVKEEPAKLVQGKTGEPGAAPRPAFREEEESEEEESATEESED